QIVKWHHMYCRGSTTHSSRTIRGVAWGHWCVFYAHSFREKLRFPPDLAIRQTSRMIMSWDNALHMSYMVSAATEAPVRASISTPVFASTSALHHTNTSLFSSTDMLTVQ